MSQQVFGGQKLDHFARICSRHLDKREVFMHRQENISRFRQLSQAACGAFLALAFLTSMGCAARYSPEALQAMALTAEYAEVCGRPPIVQNDSLAFAHKTRLKQTVSANDWEEFEEFAANADRIYRVDPNAPEITMSRLPWPYQTMMCRTLASTEKPSLPKGIKPLEISPEMREALISALIDRASLYMRPPSTDEQATRIEPNKNFIGGGLFAGPYIDNRSQSERLEATGQMLRDAVRAILPRVPGPKDEQISIIDTKTGQVIGGVGAGAAIGTVPGGTFIADAMLQSDKVPQPTREFIVGEKLGEMGSGVVQIGAGTALGAGGVAASSTGAGVVIGAPACVVGVGLIINGTVTFFNGSRSLIVAICNWNELPSVEQGQPLAAVAPKDTAGPPAPPPASPAPAPAQVKPSSEPVAAPVKPVVAAPVKPPVPAKPVAKPAKPPSPVAKSTEPIVVRTSPGGTTTTTRPRLKDGQEPCDTTLTVRTDDAGKVQSMSVEVKAAELKPYKEGGGHHPVAKKAMDGAPNYDAKKALAIPKAELERLGINHDRITQAQRKAYIDLSKTGAPLTWDTVAKIETQALISAEMKADTARATVAKAIQALKESGVVAPMRIPWGKQ
jgi:hypothetical protein